MQYVDKSSSSRTRQLKGVVAVQTNRQGLLALPKPFSDKSAESWITTVVGRMSTCCGDTVGAGTAVAQIPLITHVMIGNGSLTVFFNIIRSVTSWTAIAESSVSGDVHEATETTSPIRITGVTNARPYTIKLKNTSDINNLSVSEPYIGATPLAVHSAPTLEIMEGNQMVSIYISAPSSYETGDISYEKSIDNFLTWEPVELFEDTNSFIETGLVNGKQTTIYVRAVNELGGGEFASISGTPFAAVPPAPLGLSVQSVTSTSVTIAFTQPEDNTPAVNNYKYSTGGDTYVELSSADVISPITITGLTTDREYTIRLKAVNTDGESEASAPITVTPTLTPQIEIIRSSGSWTAPEGVTSVDYLIVGGGGGGGGAYSFMDDFGEVPVVYTYQKPADKTYWIQRFEPNGGNPNLLMKDSGVYFGNKQFKLTATNPSGLFPTPEYPNDITALSIASNTSSNIKDRWYNGVPLVYRWNNNIPVLANGFNNLNQRGFYINSDILKLESGGSGGGAGGEVKAGTCDVDPGTEYTVEVGLGGAGGSASSSSENNGDAGGSSSFNEITSLGGSGGGHSRNMIKPANGYRTGGIGGFTMSPYVPTYIFPGQGGASAQDDNASATDYVNNCISNINTTTYSTIGNGVGGLTNDITGTELVYSAGGKGGMPGAITTITPVQNTGTGGSGTGAPLNTGAEGGAGASGVVVIKYYL